jgi:CubicO group peptidase (beta-lactamase class C family)
MVATCPILLCRNAFRGVTWRYRSDNRGSHRSGSFKPPDAGKGAIRRSTLPIDPLVIPEGLALRIRNVRLSGSTCFDLKDCLVMTRIVSLLCAAATVLLPFGAQAGTAPVVQLAKRDANALARAFILEKMATRHIPGMQIAVVRGGRIVMSEAFGVANVEHQVAVTPDTVFPINSATKSFTGVAAMQLVEAGKLDLDAPISRYLDGLPAAWQAIRVRQLLAHTSGLPNIVDRNGLIGGGGEAAAWVAVKALPLESAAGTRFSYNQTNYALLAQIIDKQSGMPFADFFAARQFRPAGMTRVRFGDSFDIVPGAATPYSFYGAGHGGAETKELGRWRDDLPPFTRTGAGMNASAREIAGWIVALQGGKLLAKPDSLPRLWTADTLDSGSPAQWGMGWPVVRATPHRIVGGIGGGRSAFFIYPDDNLAIVVLTNLVGADPQQFIDQIAAFYLP